ncbi:hypothetical protein D3C81_1833180 [compost metagenome]
MHELALLPIAVEVGVGHRLQHGSQQWADFNHAGLLRQLGAQRGNQVDGAVVDALLHHGAVGDPGRNPGGAGGRQQAQLLRQGDARAALTGEQQLPPLVLMHA